MFEELCILYAILLQTRPLSSLVAAQLACEIELACLSFQTGQ